MKKSIVLALLVLFIAVPFTSAAEVPVDLVVLMDNSESVFQYYDNIVDYIITYVIKDYIRIGDTFHLISFSNSPQIEIAQKVKTGEDFNPILGRLYLMYPIGKSTDFISALSFLNQYLSVIPENSRKIAVIITDGIHNPDKSSQYYGLDADKVSGEIETIAQSMRDSGWTIILIKVPFTTDADGKTASGSTASLPGQENAPALKSDDVFNKLSQKLGVNTVTFDPSDKEHVAVSTMSLPKLTFPSHLGKKDYSFSAPFKAENVSNKEIFLELSSVTSEGTEILADKSFLRLGPKAKGTLSVPLQLPETTALGETALTVSLSFSNGVRVVPSKGILSFTLAPSPLTKILRTAQNPIILTIIIVILIITLLIIILLLRKTSHAKSDAVVVGAVTESYERAKAEKHAIASGQAVAATRTESAKYGSEMAADRAGSLAKTGIDARSPQTTGLKAQAGEKDSHGSAFKIELKSDARNPESRKQEAIGTTVTSRPEIEPNSAFKIELKSDARHGDSKKTDIPVRAGTASENEQGSAFKIELKSAVNATVPAWVKIEQVKTKKELLEEKRNEEISAIKDEALAKSLETGLSVKKQGTIQVLFTIDEQNRNIGMRNVHHLKAGSKLTVGSGRADFLVFVIPVPSKIGEVFYDGENLTFIPIRKDYFPELTGMMENCLGKTIMATTKDGFRMTLKFEEYISPADKVNNFLRCLELPVLPKE